MYIADMGANTNNATDLISTRKKPVVLDGCRVRVETELEVEMVCCNVAYIRPAR